MSRPPLVTVDVDGHAAELVLAHPPLNLVTADLLVDLHRAVRRLERIPGIWSVVVHGGASRAFCAGSDMTAFAHVAEAAAERKLLLEDHVLRRLARLPAPTIAAIDGPALGGGLELALACDLRVAHESATMGLTESRIGGLAGSGAVRLARLVGPARAMEMLFTARTLSADEGATWGLVTSVATGRSALAQARDLASSIRSRGPLSNSLAKALVLDSLDLPLDAALSRSTTAQERVYDSSDLHEGAAAFLARRNPVFCGA